MRNKDIELKLRNLIDNEVPDKLDDILSRCDKDSVVSFKSKRKNNFLFRRLAYSCSFILILVLGLFGLNIYNSNYKTDSVIEFDVNPSIELEVNIKNKVTKAQSLNDDGQKILSGMDLRNSDLNIAVNAIIGSMYKEGYISEIKNSILVSVKSKDKNKSDELQKKLQSDISEILDRYSIKGSVITQELVVSEESSAKANEAGISEGKTKYIEKILDSGLTNNKGEPYTFETLSKLSINELNVILTSKNKKISNVTTSGKANISSYISRDKAINVALKDSRLSDYKKEIKTKVEFDYKNNLMVYEVAFKYNGANYEYEINAITGKVLEKKKKVEKKKEEVKEEEKKEEPGIDTPSIEITGSDKAKEISLNDASLLEKDIKNFAIENKEKTYEVSFESEDYKYIYEIDAETFSILEKKKEILEKENNENPNEKEQLEDHDQEEDKGE